MKFETIPRQSGFFCMLRILHVQLWSRLLQELEIKQHAFSLLQERVQGSESAQLAGRVAALESQLQEASQAAQAARDKKQGLIAAAKARLSLP